MGVQRLRESLKSIREWACTDAPCCTEAHCKINKQISVKSVAVVFVLSAVN